jgi:hypothetical protein
MLVHGGVGELLNGYQPKVSSDQLVKFSSSPPLGSFIIRMPTDSENVAQLRSYLNHKARIKVSDGRIFIGLFVCTDKDKNTILAHAEEYRGGK